jgi:diguanylate cyclase (GGDEF)-like protein/PAS domain S-box-containing protein
MKSTFQRFHSSLFRLLWTYPLALSSLFFLLLSSIFSLYFWSVYKREVDSHLENTTKELRHIWTAISKAHEDMVLHYYRTFTEDEKTLSYLRMALSKDERSLALARAGLYRHLWKSYEEMSDRFYIKHLTFVLPDNLVFLRFHAPELYGDDVALLRPDIALVNEKKEPTSSFLVGDVTSGYCYVFPIFDGERHHLGTVSFCKSTESIKGVLMELFPDKDFYLLVMEEVVRKRVLEEYRWLYRPIKGLKGWLIEKPEGELYSLLEHEGVLKELIKKRLPSLMESKKDFTHQLILNKKYYRLTFLRPSEKYGQSHAVTLLILSPAPELALAYSRFLNSLFTSLSFNFVISGILYLYFKKVHTIREQQEKLETITSVMGGGLFVLDRHGVAVYVNQTACHMLGYSSEELLGKVVHDIIHVHRGDIHECPIFKATAEGRGLDYDDSFIRKDGSLLDVHIRVRPIFVNHKFSGSVVLFYDISERKKKEEELYKLAITDPLTGLYNRRFMLDQLMRVKLMAERYSIPFSVLFIDLDNFKKINDIYGHEMGDRVLKATANVIKSCLRRTDIPSRWGGEEFLVLLENTGLQEAVDVAERIRKEIETEPVEGFLKITISIGVAQYSKGEDVDSLIDRADKALYRAKATGKNRVST